MRKFYTLTLAALCSLCFTATPAVADDHIVGTEVTKKNVLLEDYTGIHCGNCPDAHKIAANIVRNHHESVYVMAIHAGSYAVPGRDEIDMRTDEGEQIHNYFGISGYPSGILNRTHISDDPNNLVVTRSYWVRMCKEQMAIDAPVNLAMTATYDGSTKRLSVTVEGYCNDASRLNNPRLTIAYLQDNIMGAQQGGLVGEEYMHQHILRGFVNGLWGEAITGIADGEYFTKTYTIDLPTEVRDVPLIPADMHLVAYLTNGKEEVQQVTGCKPTYENYDAPLMATIANPLIPVTKSYAFNFIETNIESRSAVTITSATFDVNYNGQHYTVEWDGELLPGEKKDISIPFTLPEITNSNSLTLTLKALNGQNVTTSSIKGSFGQPIACNPTLSVAIKTNKEAAENHFLLRDTEGNIVKEFGPFPQGEISEVSETVELEEGKTYCFEVTDEWGDGIASPSGRYTLKDSDGTLVAQVMSISYFGSRTFFTTSNPTGIAPVSKAGFKPAERFGIDGVRIGNNQKNTQPYILRSADKTIKILK